MMSPTTCALFRHSTETEFNQNRNRKILETAIVLLNFDQTVVTQTITHFVNCQQFMFSAENLNVAVSLIDDTRLIDFLSLIKPFVSLTSWNVLHFNRR